MREHVDGLDGVVHAIAYGNPETILGGKFIDGPWEDVAQAVQVSAYSYKSLAEACLPLMSRAAASSAARSTPRSPGPAMTGWGSPRARSSPATAIWRATSARRASAPTWCRPEPLKTLAAKAIPGFELFEEEWTKRAPLGWDLTDLEPTARTIVALLSDFLPKTTGEIIHVDGGYHAMGA